MIIATLIKDELVEGSTTELQQATFELPHNVIGPPCHLLRNQQMWTLQGSWHEVENKARVEGKDFVCVYRLTSSRVYSDISYVKPVSTNAKPVSSIMPTQQESLALGGK